MRGRRPVYPGYELRTKAPHCCGVLVSPWAQVWLGLKGVAEGAPVFEMDQYFFSLIK